MAPAPATSLDPDSAGWLDALTADGPVRDAAYRRLHELLVRVARAETHRRAVRSPVGGVELDDLAQQAADDAMLAILAKLDRFRGESRFTTWAYRFVVIEVSAKLGRHFWRDPATSLDTGSWELLPDRFGLRPEHESEWRDLLAALRRAVEEQLTARQREVFVALVLTGVPLDALSVRLGATRNALYKTMFDARRKLRAALVADGYLDDEEARAAVSARSRLDRFLRTDPRDVGCAGAVEMLHVYADLLARHADAGALYPGVAAHLHACGPCAEDLTGLLAAVTGRPAEM